MFGRKKRVHEQAIILMNEWNQIFAACEDVEVDIDPDDELAQEELAFNLEITLLGVLIYYVAALGKEDVAKEMIKIFMGIFDQQPGELNPHNVSVYELRELINDVYLKAREIAITLKDKPARESIHEHALLTVELCGIDESNVEFLENCYKIFYEGTANKIYG